MQREEAATYAAQVEKINRHYEAKAKEAAALAQKAQELKVGKLVPNSRSTSSTLSAKKLSWYDALNCNRFEVSTEPWNLLQLPCFWSVRSDVDHLNRSGLPNRDVVF